MGNNKSIPEYDIINITDIIESLDIHIRIPGKSFLLVDNNKEIGKITTDINNNIEVNIKTSNMSHKFKSCHYLEYPRAICIKLLSSEYSGALYIRQLNAIYTAEINYYSITPNVSNSGTINCILKIN